MIGAFDMYYIVFFVVVGGLVHYSRKKAKATSEQAVVTEDFKRFQRSYVVIYLILTMADWMQGPYLYALYDSYGHSAQTIGQLFIAGFGTAALCSTFVGSLADKYGRKRMCQVFCVVLMMSCLTKHSSSFSLLLIGRVLGGLSSSILFSSFESWMVHQHLFLNYPEKWMQSTFEIVVSGTGVGAMVSGLVATFLASQFGHVAPFDCAIIFASLGLLLLSRAWPENYGDRDISVVQTLENAYESIRGDQGIMLLGISQALFEAGMYIFVVMWTPTLDETSATPVSHGWVFSTFMVCIILGGTLYKQYLTYGGTVEKLMVFACGAGAISLGIPVIVTDHTLQLISFCVFETCVGVFWPTASSLRSMYFPEDTRASVMATLRVPQNILIMSVLFMVGQVQHSVILFTAFLFICAATLAQWYFIKNTLTETDVIEELGIVDDNISTGGNNADVGLVGLEKDARDRSLPMAERQIEVTEIIK
ncbi:hypothetical protein AAMO2058_001037100 [Amorphochlora amoebiformis]|mmetsp:Transcript_25443/g.40177  ORF Transcript_25443/g.40177 Transcript_25443/m.40177 type:complete len:477 (-) Transcript_25443:183-1613(-)